MTFLPSPRSRRELAPSSPRESRCPSPFVTSPTPRHCRHSDSYPEAWRWFESPARLWVCRSFEADNSTTFDVVVFLFLYFCLLRSRRFRGSGRGRLQNQHAIAEAVETIPVTDRFLVCTKNEFASSKRAHQHE